MRVEDHKYQYLGEVLMTYDGDTFTKVRIDKGMNEFSVKRVRLMGIQAPEVRPLETREAGIAARNFLMDQIFPAGEAITLSGLIPVHSLV